MQATKTNTQPTLTISLNAQLLSRVMAILTLGCAFLIIVGMLLPWATSSLFFSDRSLVSGMDVAVKGLGKLQSHLGSSDTSWIDRAMMVPNQVYYPAFTLLAVIAIGALALVNLILRVRVINILLVLGILLFAVLGSVGYWGFNNYVTAWSAAARQPSALGIGFLLSAFAQTAVIVVQCIDVVLLALRK